MKHLLPPMSIARLAALNVTQKALAELISIEPLYTPTHTGSDPRASFRPTHNTIKAAEAGLAGLVLSRRPALAGDITADVSERLVRLGVPEASAFAVVEQLVARTTLSRIFQTPQQVFDAVAAVVGSPDIALKDGRL